MKLFRMRAIISCIYHIVREVHLVKGMSDGILYLSFTWGDR